MKDIIMGNQQESSKLQLAWLGGIWDGEGTITFVLKQHIKYQPTCSVVNTNKIIIDKVIHILEDNKIPHWVHFYEATKTWKRRWRVEVSGLRRTKKFLIVLMPYLVSKKQQAALMLEFVESRLKKLGIHPYYDSREQEIFLEVRELNKKGPK
jgi:hypothetical protein